MLLRSDCQGKFANRPAIDENHSRLRIVDARNQIDQRGFSRTRRTDDRHTAAGWNPQVQIVQHGLAFVCKIQPAEFDLALHLRGPSPSASSLISGFSCIISFRRIRDAVPRWKIFTTQPSAIMGNVNCIM